jgi:uncharacterized delta-60 repeat protein
MSRSPSPFTLFLLFLLAAGCGSVKGSGPGDTVDNVPPEAVAAQLSTWMSTPVEGQLQGEDDDGDRLAYAVAADPVGGTLELDEEGRFRYTPEPGRSGSDAFSFVVDDGSNLSDEAIVDIAIATLTDGTPDAAFGAGGAVRTDFGETDALSGVAVTRDGRVVAVGSSASSQALVAGYSASGELADGFGEAGDGTTRLSLGGGYNGHGDVIQQASGRLVSVGQTQDEVSRDFVLLGLDDQGMIDSSFGDGGVAVTDVGAGEDDVARAVVRLADDRLLLAGYANNGLDDDFAVARYAADGTLDPGFGSGGSTLVDLGGLDRAIGMAVDAAGNILLVGEASGDMAIARLTADGAIDTSFAVQGRLKLDFGSYDEAVGVAFGADGALYVGGNSELPGDLFRMVVVKLSPDGEVDPSFGEDGRAVADSGAASTYATTMLLLPNHTLLLLGGWTQGSVTEAAAVRFHLVDGKLDTGFGEAGFYHQEIGSAGQDTLFAAALQPDGKVVAAGWSRNADLDGLLVRLGW